MSNIDTPPLLHIKWFQATQRNITVKHTTGHQNKQLIKNKHFLLNRQERAGVLQYLIKR